MLLSSPGHHHTFLPHSRKSVSVYDGMKEQLTRFVVQNLAGDGLGCVDDVHMCTAFGRDVVAGTRRFCGQFLASPFSTRSSSVTLLSPLN